MTIQEKWSTLLEYNNRCTMRKMPDRLRLGGIITYEEATKIQKIVDMYYKHPGGAITNNYAILAVNLMYEKLMKFQEKL